MESTRLPCQFPNYQITQLPNSLTQSWFARSQEPAVEHDVSDEGRYAHQADRKSRGQRSGENRRTRTGRRTKTGVEFDFVWRQTLARVPSARVENRRRSHQPLFDRRPESPRRFADRQAPPRANQQRLRRSPVSLAALREDRHARATATTRLVEFCLVAAVRDEAARCRRTRMSVKQAQPDIHVVLLAKAPAIAVQIGGEDSSAFPNRWQMLRCPH